MPTIITLQRIEALRRQSPRRCRIHDVVRKKDDGTYVVSTKFASVNRLFEAETQIRTKSGPYGPYVFLSEQNLIDTALKWQEVHRSLIFLRDSLDCSLALDFNLAELGKYTELGQAEHDAKATGDRKAIEYLAARCGSAVTKLGLYKDCSTICAVSPSPGKDWDLPTEIAKRVALASNKEDISEFVRFRKHKRSVKSLALGDRWGALEDAQLDVTMKLTGKNVIILDDKYQSGTTIQYVASKLLEAGASEVFGLCCVKTWRDTDNR